jgi:peroxiredoxin
MKLSKKLGWMTAVLLCIVVSVAFLCGEEKEFIQKALDLLEMKEYEQALEVIELGFEKHGKTMDLINTKYKILLAARKYEAALSTFEEIIKKAGDSPDVMVDKIRLLMNLERYDEALEVAFDVDKKSKEKSPYISFFVFDIYLTLSNKDEAYRWLEKSVNRGLSSYDYLLNDDYKALHNDKRFKDIISEMKARTGIGKPTKDFSAPLLSGGDYALGQDNGKIVLIDFWATWCLPCVAEFPRLRELYSELHQKGFEIIGISLDSNRQVLEKFMTKNDIPWKIVFSGNGQEDETAKLYNIDSVPKYLLIDREGVLRFSLDTGGENLENAVLELLKKS